MSAPYCEVCGGPCIDVLASIPATPENLAKFEAAFWGPPPTEPSALSYWLIKDPQPDAIVTDLTRRNAMGDAVSG